MRIKKTFTTPQELVKELMNHKGIISIKIKCLGMMPFVYVSDTRNTLWLRKSSNDLWVTNAVLKFPIEYIEEVEFSEADKCDMKCFSVVHHYFKQFIKDEVVQQLDEYEWSRRNSELITMIEN